MLGRCRRLKWCLDERWSEYCRSHGVDSSPLIYLTLPFHIVTSCTEYCLYVDGYVGDTYQQRMPEFGDTEVLVCRRLNPFRHTFSGFPALDLFGASTKGGGTRRGEDCLQSYFKTRNIALSMSLRLHLIESIASEVST